MTYSRGAVNLSTGLNLAKMGNLVNGIMFPAPKPSYTSTTLRNLKMINWVPTLWYQPVSKSRGVLLYLHSNGTDLGSIRRMLYQLARDTRLTVVAVEYPGYGISPGVASPENVVAAARRVYTALQEQRRRGNLLVVVGRSIGTGVGSQLVCDVIREEGMSAAPDALVLISPFLRMGTMGHRHFGEIGQMLTDGVFDSEAAVKEISVPTMVIHGIEDVFIPIDQGRQLLDASAAERKRLVELPHSDHTVLEWPVIFRSIKDFVHMGINDQMV